MMLMAPNMTLYCSLYFRSSGPCGGPEATRASRRIPHTDHGADGCHIHRLRRDHRSHLHTGVRHLPDLPQSESHIDIVPQTRFALAPNGTGNMLPS